MALATWVWWPFSRSPSANCYRFLFRGGLPYRNRLQKKGTLILSSLEELVLVAQHVWLLVWPILRKRRTMSNALRCYA